MVLAADDPNALMAEEITTRPDFSWGFAGAIPCQNLEPSRIVAAFQLGRDELRTNVGGCVCLCND